MLFAAVDIGSNASRLLFSHVYEHNGKLSLAKASLVRIPTRLGKDVFTLGRISDERLDKLTRTMRAYKMLIDVYEPAGLSICATAALREAENSDRVIDHIKSETGWNIKLINGKEESKIIRDAGLLDDEANDAFSMFIDVGGGSTEISVMDKGKLIDEKSFKIGTLRFPKSGQKEIWKKIDKWLDQFEDAHGKIYCMGSGGNINKISKVFGNPRKKYIHTKDLIKARKILKNLSLEERMTRYSMRPDRADVIVEAAEIFIFILKNIKVKKINVPKLGLADGLVLQMFRDLQKQD